MKILGICGAQGALLYKARRYVIGNVEPRAVFHTPNEEQWKLNFGDIPFVRCLDELQGVEPDIIVGSPSCGHSSRFSYSRKKSLGKPREDETLNMFINAVQVYQPKVFVMENLPKLLDLVPLTEWSEILNGYRIISHCHPVSVFGNSQTTRKRMVLIGIKKGSHTLRGVDFTDIFSCRKTLSTCRDLHSLILPDRNFCEEPSKTVSMYHYSDVSKKSMMVSQVEKMWQEEFKGDYRWPMKGHKMKTLPGVYRNRWDAYPLTLRPSNRQFAPDGKIMGLEWYRLIMGFPKSYKIHYDSSNPTYWLNKGRVAYTKGATYEIGLWLYRLLKKYKAL